MSVVELVRKINGSNNVTDLVLNGLMIRIESGLGSPLLVPGPGIVLLPFAIAGMKLIPNIMLGPNSTPCHDIQGLASDTVARVLGAVFLALNLQ
jgi:hypothetical protein